jgi:hypothetical protein
LTNYRHKKPLAINNGNVHSGINKGIQKRGLSLNIMCCGFQKYKKHILKNYKKWFGPYKV